MTNDPQPQTVTPERQIAATRIGAVFSQMHGYLQSLQSKDDKGQPILTAMLQNAHCRLEEAQFWAIKHALMFGVPSLAANDGKPPAPSEANETLPVAPPVVANGADVEPPTPDDSLAHFMTGADEGRAPVDDPAVN